METKEMVESAVFKIREGIEEFDEAVKQAINENDWKDTYIDKLACLRTELQQIELKLIRL